MSAPTLSDASTSRESRSEPSTDEAEKRHTPRAYPSVTSSIRVNSHQPELITRFRPPQVYVNTNTKRYHDEYYCGQG